MLLGSSRLSGMTTDGPGTDVFGRGVLDLPASVIAENFLVLCSPMARVVVWALCTFTDR